MSTPVPHHAWVIEGQVAVAVRPGRRGSRFRRAQMQEDLAWWKEQGVAAIVSMLPTQRALSDYAAQGLAPRWLPVDPRAPSSTRISLDQLVPQVTAILDRGGGAVLVHGDGIDGVLTAIDATIRRGVGLAPDIDSARIQAIRSGWPDDSLLAALLAGAETLPSPGGRIIARPRRFQAPPSRW